MATMVAQQPRKEGSKRKKVIAAIAVLILAIILACAGTYAWTSFPQRNVSAAAGEVNPGGRLHDDFIFTVDTKNKDVYVENFTDAADGGAPIFARVRFKEYLEFGEGAGSTNAAAKSVVSVPSGASLANADTWEVHLFDKSNANADTFAKYFTWVTGGSKIYMPTFNKNTTCLGADAKGSIEDNYATYKVFAAGESLAGEEVTALADSTQDNCKGEGCDGRHVDADSRSDDYEATSVTHTAATTPDGMLMSMEAWKDSGSVPGPYWVYDTDGWVYWAQPLKPGEVTGLLVDNVVPNESFGDAWYYDIDATGEFVSLSEWNKESNGVCYFDAGQTKELSADAYELLEQAADALTYNNVNVAVSIAEGATPQVGSTVQMNATISRYGLIIDDYDDEVAWSVSGGNGTATIDENGLLTIPHSEANTSVLTVTATLGNQVTNGSATFKPGREPEEEILARIKAATTMNDNADTMDYASSLIEINGRRFFKLAEDEEKNATLLLDITLDVASRGQMSTNLEELPDWRETHAYSYLQTEYPYLVSANLRPRFLGFGENFEAVDPSAAVYGTVGLPTTYDFYLNEPDASTNPSSTLLGTRDTGALIPLDAQSASYVNAAVRTRFCRWVSGYENFNWAFRKIWWSTETVKKLTGDGTAPGNNELMVPMVWVDMNIVQPEPEPETEPGTESI